MQGTLHLVATPIGNLGDITLRAVECLQAVSRIYAEDTRRTRALLSHLGIEKKRLLSLHAHSKDRDLETAIEILQEGHNIALVTDAGMPTVSDPGSALVRRARQAGATITVIPGASAVTTAVAISGLVDGPFAFLGFLPVKSQKRKDALRDLSNSAIPSVLFESPHRIKTTLRELCEYCGAERKIAICRELTKRYEEVLVLSCAEAQELYQDQPALGEFSLVVERAAHPETQTTDIDVDARARVLLDDGASIRDAATTLSRELAKQGARVSRRDLYQRLLQLSADLNLGSVGEPLSDDPASTDADDEP